MCSCSPVRAVWMPNYAYSEGTLWSPFGHSGISLPLSFPLGNIQQLTQSGHYVPFLTQHHHAISCQKTELCPVQKGQDDANPGTRPGFSLSCRMCPRSLVAHSSLQVKFRVPSVSSHEDRDNNIWAGILHLSVPSLPALISIISSLGSQSSLRS